MKFISKKSAQSGATRLLVASVATATVCSLCTGLQPTPNRATAAIAVTSTIVDTASTIGIADSDLYGMSAADIDTTLDTLESIGVTSIRVFVPWALIEPAEGTYNWTYIDEVMAAAAERNMSVLAGVTSTPTWDAPSGTLLGAGTPDPTDYAAFLTAVAKRYGSEISAYEIWNEPNYIASYDPIDPATYTALLKASYTAVKAVDPSASVIAAGLGSVISFGSLTLDPVTFVQEMIADGAVGYFDALSFHPYQASLAFSDGEGVANSPLTQLEAIEALLVAAGAPTKIWITEYGEETTSEITQQTQASFIQDLIDTWETLTYAGPVYIYTAQDGTSGDFGIYEADWTPKLAVAVIAAEIAKYASSAVATSTITITTQLTTAAQRITAFVQSLATAVSAIGQQISNSISAAAQAFAQVGVQIVQAISTAVSAVAAVLNRANATSSSTSETTVTTSASADATSRVLTATTSAADHSSAVASSSATASEKRSTTSAAASGVATDSTVAAVTKPSIGTVASSSASGDAGTGSETNVVGTGTSPASSVTTTLAASTEPSTSTSPTSTTNTTNTAKSTTKQSAGSGRTDRAAVGKPNAKRTDDVGTPPSASTGSRKVDPVKTTDDDPHAVGAAAKDEKAAASNSAM